MAIFQELKRRSVFRVAISYVILAWLLMQVADTLAPALRLPEWFQSGVAFVLILGFPVALFLAWAYELTPDGLRRDAGSDSESSHTSSRTWNGLVVGLLVVALVYIAYDEFLAEPEIAPLKEVAEETTEAPPAESRSIAVLPFVDMSPDKDQEYMSDGIAEELLNLLAKIPDLQVTSRSSAFSFKGKDFDIPTVASQLKVAYVLEGSVRKSGDQIRITAQLIEAEPDKHLWSETYDRTLDDVFAIQDEIAAAVVDALKITLLGEAPQSRVVAGEAYDLALEARYFWYRRAPGDVKRALDSYREALAIQPDYALAWTGVSVALAVQALGGDIPREQGLEEARAAAEKALELDPMLADAHVRMGQAQMRAREYEAGYKSYQRALDLEPDNVLALGVMGTFLRSVGRIEEAVPMLQRTTELDPMGAIWHGNLASVLIQAGRYDEAESSLNRALELNPARNVGASFAMIALMRGNARQALELTIDVDPDELDSDMMAAIYGELGMQEESDLLLEQLLQEDSRGTAFSLPGVYAARGEIDEAFEALESIRAEIGGRRGAIEYDPILSRYLSEDPRWTVLLDAIQQQGPDFDSR